MSRDDSTLIVTEARLVRLPDGSVWGNAAFGPRAWQRYLKVFQRVRVVARVSGVDGPEPGSVRVDVPGQIEIVEIPDYVGLTGLLAASLVVARAIGRAAGSGPAVVIRVPTTSGALLAPLLWWTRRPYAVEVVGDPAEVFAPGVVDHPIRAVVRWAAVLETRQLCAHATAAIYVTRRTLQKKYPPAHGAFAVASPNVLLDEASFIKPRRPSGAMPVIVTIGSMDQMYKGIDVLLESVALLNRRGTCAQLRIVGDGRQRGVLEAQVEALGLGEYVTFAGQVEATEVRSELHEADLFVLASRTEGLPRVMVEAMAAGLACVGTTVGGVPELLEDDALVPPDDAVSLAEVIGEFLQDEKRRDAAAARNQAVARDWALSASSDTRREAYEMVRAETITWWEERGRSGSRVRLRRSWRQPSGCPPRIAS